MADKIDVRSPYFLKITDASIAYATLDLYVYTGAYLPKPATPDYTLKKNAIGTNTFVIYEISELVRDFIDLDVGNKTSSSCVNVYAELEAFDSSDVSLGSQTLITLAFDGYSYYDKTKEREDAETQLVLMSVDTVYAFNERPFYIPIDVSTGFAPVDIIYLKDGAVVATDSKAGGTSTSTSIAYITPFPTDEIPTFEQYYNRVTANLGTVEDTECSRIFLNTLCEPAQADTIIVSNASASKTIKVITKNEKKYEPIKVTFINKFGVFQDVYFFKKSVEKMSVKRQEYKSNVLESKKAASSVSYDSDFHRYKQYNANGMESITLSSGFVGEDQNEVFKQLLLSEQVWAEVLNDDDNRYITKPINIKSNDITYKTSVNDRLVEYTIEFSYAYDVINNIR